jgi:hypothetical protein
MSSDIEVTGEGDRWPEREAVSDRSCRLGPLVGRLPGEDPAAGGSWGTDRDW